ncbi:MAG: hypothetical protein WHT06_12140 [Desulfobacterales bacterium]
MSGGRRLFLFLAGLLLVCQAAAGCGRKMPPIRPGSYPPPAVANLGYAWGDGEALVLSWDAPAPRGEKESPAEGFRVLRARLQPGEENCRGCSVRYEVVGQVRVESRGEDGRFRFVDRPAPGFLYRYKVTAYSAEGLVSRESAVLQPRR